MSEKQRCNWCRGWLPANPQWEQKSLLSDRWSAMCNRCANRKLRKGIGAIRRIGDTEDQNAALVFYGNLIGL